MKSRSLSAVLNKQIADLTLNSIANSLDLPEQHSVIAKDSQQINVHGVTLLISDIDLRNKFE